MADENKQLVRKLLLQLDIVTIRHLCVLEAVNDHDVETLMTPEPDLQGGDVLLDERQMAAYLGHTKAPQVILDCQRSSFLQGVERHTVILAKFLAELHHERGLTVTAVAPHEPAAPDFRSVEGILPFPFEREYVILLVQDVPDIQGTSHARFFIILFLFFHGQNSVSCRILSIRSSTACRAAPRSFSWQSILPSAHKRAFSRVANCPHLRPGLKPPPEPPTSM